MSNQDYASYVRILWLDQHFKHDYSTLYFFPSPCSLGFILTSSQAMASLSLTCSPQLFSFNSIQCRKNPEETAKLSSNGQLPFPEKNPLILQPTKIPPPRPRRIILVRHGESEGNVDESTYTRIADPKIRLTEKGKVQAQECGQRIRQMIEKDGATDWKVYFYVSPYRRTLETLQNLAQSFERTRIAGMREEPRLREQDFGNLSFPLQINKFFLN